MAPFAPPLPEGAGSPFQWGDEAYVEEMLGGSFDVTFHEGNSPYEGDDATEMWTFFRDHYGPTFTVWSSLDEERRAELDRAMVDLLEESRVGDRIRQERHYIVAIGTRR